MKRKCNQMSHMIFARKNSKDKTDNEILFDGIEIAELNYSMSNNNSYIPYALLNSLENHGGVSGNGERKEYTFEDIQNALKNIEKVKDFFTQIEKEMDSDNLNKITIWWG